ncbi:MAG: porin family protein [Bacteriovoracia bacterium]
MRKIQLSVILVLALFSSLVYATETSVLKMDDTNAPRQTIEGFDRTKVGFHGGVAISNANINSKVPVGSSPNVFMTVGATADFRIKSTILSLQPELNYVGKGFESNFALSPAGQLPRKVSVNLDYLEVPLLLKASLGGQVDPYLYAGPSVAFLIGKRVQVNQIGSGVSSSDLLSGEFEHIQFGLNIGGGVGVDIGNQTALLLDIRFQQGISNLIKQYREDVVRISSAQFTTGIQHRFF